MTSTVRFYLKLPQYYSLL